MQFPARLLARLIRGGVRKGAGTVGRQYGAHDALDGAATSGGRFRAHGHSALIAALSFVRFKANPVRRATSLYFV